MPATTTDRLQGLTTSVAVKAPCRVATTAAITLSGLQTIDGVALAASDRVLVKDQGNTVTNGIYTAATGEWARALDFDGTRDAVGGTYVFVSAGTIWHDSNHRVVGNGPITIGTDAITFTPAYFSGASAEDIATVAGSIDDVETVAGSIANVNIVAGSIANVNTVAGSIDDVETVAADLDLGVASSIVQAPAAAAAALAAAGVVGIEATKAALDAAIGSYTNGDYILVVADENYGGVQTIYLKTAGVAVFSRFAGIAPQFDPLGRAELPPYLTDYRSLGMHIRKALDDVRSGARLYLTGLTVSDSYGLLEYPGGPQQFSAICAGHFKDSPVRYPINTSQYYDEVPGSGQPVTGKFTCTNNIRADYNKVWTGCDQSFTANGQLCCYSGDSGGSGRSCDYIRIFLLTDTGGGTFKVEIANTDICPATGAGDWVNPTAPQIVSSHTLTAGELLVSTNAAAGMTVVKLSLAYGKWHVKLTKTTGGNATSIPPNFETHSRSAINTYRLSVGSNNPSSETTAANPYMTALLTDLQPDFVYFGGQDELDGYQNFLPKLETALTGAALTFKPLVLLEVSAYSMNQTNVIARIDYMKSYAAPRMGWTVVDLMATVGGLAEATREGIEGDDEHPYATNPLAYVDGWRVWANTHGLLARFVPGVASYHDAVSIDSANTRLVNGRGLMAAMMSPARINTGPMTWGRLASSSASTTVTRNPDNSLTLTTTTTANDKVTAFIDEILPVFGRVSGARPLSAGGGMGFSIQPLVANATGVLRIIWANRTYNAAHAGILASYGFGVIVENLTLTLIGWDFSTEARSASSWTLTTNQVDDVVIVLDEPSDSLDTTSTVECFVNGQSIGTVSILNNGNVTALRAEMSNGATAAAYSVKITPPVLHTTR